MFWPVRGKTDVEYGKGFDYHSTEKPCGATFMAANEGKPMAGGTFMTTIQAPPERVWELVSDIGTHGSWSPKKYTVEWVTGRPNQVGSTFHSVGWGLGEQTENTSEITEPRAQRHGRPAGPEWSGHTPGFLPTGPDPTSTPDRGGHGRRGITTVPALPLPRGRERPGRGQRIKLGEKGA